MPTYLKPGYRTSEAVVTVATIIGLVLASSADWLPPKYAALGSTLTAIGYALSRGLAKMNPPKDAAPPQ